LNGADADGGVWKLSLTAQQSANLEMPGTNFHPATCLNPPEIPLFSDAGQTDIVSCLTRFLITLPIPAPQVAGAAVLWED
jgi:hypothetical protein